MDQNQDALNLSRPEIILQLCIESFKNVRNNPSPNVFRNALLALLMASIILLMHHVKTNTPQEKET